MSQTTRRALLIGMTAALASCGSFRTSRLNPRNWFGGSRARGVSLDAQARAEAADGRPVVDQITDLTIEPVQSGAILRATGLPPQQGHYDGELVEVTPPDGDPGTLIYVFRLAGPWGPSRVSTPQSREVVVAEYLTHRKLAGVRRIVVEAERNSRTLSR